MQKVECSRCQKLYSTILVSENPHICSPCKARLRIIRLKEQCIEYKGGKCLHCGYNKHFRAMAFHHTDPKQKDFGISLKQGAKWDRLKAELDKTILLCSNCHANEHHRLRVLDRPQLQSLVFKGIIEGVVVKTGECVSCSKFVGDENLNKDKLCKICIVNNRRFTIKLNAIGYKGGSCSSCGYNKTPVALCFQHINSSNKEFGLGGKHCLSWNKIKTELDKTKLLCLNCHQEELGKIVKIPRSARG